MTLTAFIVGLVIGLAVGIVAVCACVIAAEADRQVEDILRGL